MKKQKKFWREHFPISGITYYEGALGFVPRRKNRIIYKLREAGFPSLRFV
jgi:hypothetical protein